MLLCLVVLIQKNTDSFVVLLMDTNSSIEVIHANCQHLVSVSLFSLLIQNIYNICQSPFVFL
ncbi:unnamed protein product [Prunus brigantina]